MSLRAAVLIAGALLLAACQGAPEALGGTLTCLVHGVAKICRTTPVQKNEFERSAFGGRQISQHFGDCAHRYGNQVAVTVSESQCAATLTLERKVGVANEKEGPGLEPEQLILQPLSVEILLDPHICFKGECILNCDGLINEAIKWMGLWVAEEDQAVNMRLMTWGRRRSCGGTRR